MIIRKKQTEIVELDIKINNLNAEIKLINAQKQLLIKELSLCIKSELDSLTPEKVMTMPHPVFSTEEGEDILSNYMGQFKHITASNYWAQSGTQAARVTFDKTICFENHYEEIMQFLPYCTELLVETVNEERHKVRAMKVLDPTAGKLGVITIGLNEQNNLYLFKTLNSVTHIYKHFSDVKEGLKFLYDNHSFDKAYCVA